VSTGVLRPVAVLAALAFAGPGVAACGSDETPTLEAGEGSTTTSDGADGTTSAPEEATTTTVAGGAEVESVSVPLTGEAVAPAPTAATAGTAEATLTYDGDELCLEGTTTGLGPVVAGHVHAGPAGESGPVVVDFGITTEADGPFSGCAVVGAEGGVVLVDPAAYYVQLHTPDLPQGAVRAQLA